jgi:hypothetical protein
MIEAVLIFTHSELEIIYSTNIKVILPTRLQMFTFSCSVFLGKTEVRVSKFIVMKIST